MHVLINGSSEAKGMPRFNVQTAEATFEKQESVKEEFKTGVLLRRHVT
jgi:hypothetical protein